MAEIVLGTIPGTGLWPIKPDSKLSIPLEKLQHTQLMGKPGVGKSFLIASIAFQLYRQGIGFTLVDPHGATVDLIRDLFISYGVFKNNPKSYDRIRILRFKEGDAYPAYDPLAFSWLTPSERRDFVLESAHRRWRVLQEAALFDQVWYHGLVTLMDNSLPLPELFYLYGSKQIERAPFMANLTEPSTKFFWERIWNEMRPDQQATYGGAASRRADVFVKKPILKWTTGNLGKNVIDPLDNMAKKRVILISTVDADEESRKMLNSLVVHSYEIAAPKRRSATAPHYLIIEEMSDMVANSGQALANMLDRTRKFGLFVILCHQRWEQGSINEQLPNALGGAHIRICMRLGDPNDGRIMAPVFADYSHTAIKKEAVSPTGQPILANAYDQYEAASTFLRKLPDRHAVVRIGEQPPTPIVTLPIPSTTHITQAQIDEVESKMVELYYTPQQLITLPHDRDFLASGVSAASSPRFRP